VDHVGWLILLGFAVGAYGTLIGAGGGFVLMPLMLLLYPNEPPEVLTAISLVVVFFNAASGSAAYARMGRIDFRAGLLFAAAGIPGAVAGAFCTEIIPRRAFDVTFGVLMIAAALALLLSRTVIESTAASHQAGHTADPAGTAAQRAPYNARLGAGISFGIGYLSSLLGIGGGIMHVPLLVRVLKFPVHVATATSHFILAILALTATVVHAADGTLAHGLWRTTFLSIGVVAGAQVGAALSNRVHGTWILRGLGLALAIVGARLLLAVWGH